MMARGLFLLGFSLALLVASGCSSSGSGGGGGGTTSPAIVCINGDAVSPDALTMSCGGETNSTTEQVNVVMGGPASGTTTLRGLNFDVTFDPSKLQFAGLTPNDPADPNALFPSSVTPLATSHTAGRVVVTIQRFEGDPDRVVSAGQYKNVFSLSFQRVAGATFGPTPLTFDNAEYTRPSPLTPIGFPPVNGPTLSY